MRNWLGYKCQTIEIPRQMAVKSAKADSLLFCKDLSSDWLLFYILYVECRCLNFCGENQTFLIRSNCTSPSWTRVSNDPICIGFGSWILLFLVSLDYFLRTLHFYDQWTDRVSDIVYLQGVFSVINSKPKNAQEANIRSFALCNFFITSDWECK